MGLKTLETRALVLVVAGVMCIGMAATVILGAQQVAPAAAASPTFSADVAPILYARCVTCHRPGEVAPMSLITYKDVRPWAGSIREKVMSLEELDAALAAVDDIGGADYADEGMLQYLRTERVVPAYQTRGHKLIELVRLYEAGTIRRRDP